MSDQKPLGLTFPCEFPIKAIGKAREDLDGIVFSLVHPHVPDLSEGAIRSRPSSKGNYVAITVTIQASSQAQLDAIYTSLSASEYLTMVL